MKNTNRVIFNTTILYGNSILTIVFSLYTTRLLLNSLGVIDFGIYNLIAGVIGALSFLNTAMATSTQRYLSFHLTHENPSKLNQIFANSIFLHFLIGVFISLLLILIGNFLFSDILEIPSERIAASQTIYKLMILSVLFTILAVPFTATIIANENMIWIVVINTIEGILKLGGAVFLYFYSDDKLILYTYMMVVVSFISLCFYGIYCLRKYPECSLNIKSKINSNILKELGVFAGWNLFGALCGVSRTQGLGVIMNSFWGTVINTSYGIANQVAGQMSFFSGSMLRAINPQIMKAEGAGNRKDMLMLSMKASKFGYFLLAFIAIPCMFEMPTLLKFWLKEVPDYAVGFCILTLIIFLCNQLTVGLQSAIQATGRIKMYQAIIGSILLLNLPISFLLLYKGFSVYLTLVSAVVLEIIGCIFRLYFLKIKAGLSIKEYCDVVFAKEFIPTLLTCAFCFFSRFVLDNEYRSTLTIAGGILIFMISSYLWGLDKDEKFHLQKLSKGFCNRIKNINNKTKI